MVVACLAPFAASGRRRPQHRTPTFAPPRLPQAAAAKSSAAADPLLKLFRIHYSAKPLQVQTAAGTHTYIEVPAFDPAWDNLWLEARLPWPLGLLLTPRHLDRWGPGLWGRFVWEAVAMGQWERGGSLRGCRHVPAGAFAG